MSAKGMLISRHETNTGSQRAGMRRRMEDKVEGEQRSAGMAAAGLRRQAFAVTGGCSVGRATSTQQ